MHYTGKTALRESGRRSRWLHRLFRVYPFDKSPAVSFRRRIIDHGLAGGALGFLVLHPLSMIAHNFFHLEMVSIWGIIALSFSYAHMPMTLYFVIVGSLFGLVHGSYIHTIAALHEEIRLLAISDELTGLFNRRFFMSRLEQEVARAQRYEHPLVLLMLDIDFFKRFNDTNGHPAGDELLRRLGGLFRDMIREADFAARYGGEEFAVVMPETEGDLAYALARRVCQTVSEYPFPHRNSQPGGKVTLSIGMAELPSDAQEMGELIQRADQALYTAKSSGKNRVCRFNTGCRV